MQNKKAGKSLLFCFLDSVFNNFCAKGKKTYCRKFKELFAERNSDDGYAPENSAAKSGKSNFPTENNNPKDVEKGASKTEVFADDFLFKRKGAKSGNFKTLNSRGNSDYAYAKENTRKSPFQPKDKSAENEPKKVSQSFQKYITFLKNNLQNILQDNYNINFYRFFAFAP